MLCFHYIFRRLRFFSFFVFFVMWLQMLKSFISSVILVRVLSLSIYVELVDCGLALFVCEEIVGKENEVGLCA